MLYFTGEALEDDESVSAAPLKHTNTNTKTVEPKPRNSHTCHLCCTTCGYVFTINFLFLFMQFEEEELEEGDEEVSITALC